MGELVIMKLVDLIDCVVNIDTTIQVELPNVETDLIEIYMINSLNIDSELKFFNSEVIPDDITINIAGIKYISLFPLHLAIEIIEEYRTINKYSSLDIAEKMIEYRINDA